MPEVEFEHGGITWQASRVLDPRKSDCPMVLRVRLKRGQPSADRITTQEATAIADRICSP